MSTVSRIAIKVSDNEFKSIYCHWDGYPSHNGEILRRYYRDENKIQSLINLGDISSLDALIDCPENHSFDNKGDDCTVAYRRDRGEEGCEVIKNYGINGLITTAINCCAEWIYFYDCKKRKWYFQSTNNVDKNRSTTIWLPLTKGNIRITKKNGN